MTDVICDAIYCKFNIDSKCIADEINLHIITHECDQMVYDFTDCNTFDKKIVEQTDVIDFDSTRPPRKSDDENLF